MNISLSKLKAILLYFAQNTNSQYLGKVKLMKLFYYLDFMHTKKYGTPITGDRYFHLEKGPIPSSIMNLVSELAQDPESSPLADDIAITNPSGTRMLQVRALRELTEEDLSLLGASEIEMLEEVAKRFRDYSTDEIVEASHQEAPWRETDHGQPIPYELAAHDSDSLYTDEEIRMLQIINA